MATLDKKVYILGLRHGHCDTIDGKRILSDKGKEQIAEMSRRHGHRIQKSTLYAAAHSGTERTEESGEIFMETAGLGAGLVSENSDFSLERPFNGAAGKIAGDYGPVMTALQGQYGEKPIPISAWFNYGPTHAAAFGYFIAMRLMAEQIGRNVPDASGVGHGLLFAHGCTMEMMCIDLDPEMPSICEYAGGVIFEWTIPWTGGRAELTGCERLLGPELEPAAA